MTRTKILNLYENNVLVKTDTANNIAKSIRCSVSTLHRALSGDNDNHIIKEKYKVEFTGKYINVANVRKSKVYGVDERGDDEIYKIAKNLIDIYGNACVVKRAGYVIDRLRREGYVFDARYVEDEFGHYWVLEVKR